MSSIALLSFGSWEPLLVIAIVLILFGARNLPGISNRLATELNQAWREPKADRPPDKQKGSQILMVIAIILGAVCLALLLANLSK